MRVERRTTEILVHLTIEEAEHVRDDLEADEFTMMADLIRRDMPSEEDDEELDDDWDDDDEDDDDGDWVRGGSVGDSDI